MARLPREPALLRKILGKTARLEVLATCSVEYAFPAAGRVESHLLYEIRTYLRWLGSLLKFEPKKTIGSQSEPVGLALDNREVDITEHLDRNCAFGLRQDEINRLSETRKVSDAQDPLVLILS